MANSLNQLQAWINILRALADLSDLIDSIIIMAGGLGGVIIPPKPETLTYENAQAWKNEMEANWIAAGSPEPPGGG